MPSGREGVPKLKNTYGGGMAGNTYLSIVSKINLLEKVPDNFLTIYSNRIILTDSELFLQNLWTHV